METEQKRNSKELVYSRTMKSIADLNTNQIAESKNLESEVAKTTQPKKSTAETAQNTLTARSLSVPNKPLDSKTDASLFSSYYESQSHTQLDNSDFVWIRPIHPADPDQEPKDVNIIQYPDSYYTENSIIKALPTVIKWHQAYLHNEMQSKLHKIKNALENMYKQDKDRYDGHTSEILHCVNNIGDSLTTFIAECSLEPENDTTGLEQYYDIIQAKSMDIKEKRNDNIKKQHDSIQDCINSLSDQSDNIDMAFALELQNIYTYVGNNISDILPASGLGETLNGIRNQIFSILENMAQVYTDRINDHKSTLSTNLKRLKDIALKDLANINEQLNKLENEIISERESILMQSHSKEVASKKRLEREKLMQQGLEILQTTRAPVRGLSWGFDGDSSIYVTATRERVSNMSSSSFDPRRKHSQEHPSQSRAQYQISHQHDHERPSSNQSGFDSSGMNEYLDNHIKQRNAGQTATSSSVLEDKSDTVGKHRQKEQNKKTTDNSHSDCFNRN